MTAHFSDPLTEPHLGRRRSHRPHLEGRRRRPFRRRAIPTAYLPSLPPPHLPMPRGRHVVRGMRQPLRPRQCPIPRGGGGAGRSLDPTRTPHRAQHPRRLRAPSHMGGCLHRPHMADRPRLLRRCGRPRQRRRHRIRLRQRPVPLHLPPRRDRRSRVIHAHMPLLARPDLRPVLGGEL